MNRLYVRCGRRFIAGPRGSQPAICFHPRFPPMRDSSPPPWFSFLRALTVLQTSRSENQQRAMGPGSALKELLGDYFPTRISQGAGALAGLDSAPVSVACTAFASETEALAALVDQVAEAGTARFERGTLDDFTPDGMWLGPARRTSRGFQWDLQRDLLTKHMVEELPKGHPERARWKRSRTSFDAGNPVEIRSRIWSTVANESSVAAYKAWFTMKGGFHPCLKGRLELIGGASPTLELKITCSRRYRAAFGLLRRRVSGRGSRTDRFLVLLGEGNVPKRIRLSLPGIADRGMIRAGWDVFRAWIEAVQLPPEKADTAANLRLWGEHPKVRRYGITDPYLAFFVAKYENRIDWQAGRIKDQESLQREVRRNMLKVFRDGMKDSCNPDHYLGWLGTTPDDHLFRGDKIYSAALKLAEARNLPVPARVVKSAERRLLACLLEEKIQQMRLWDSYLKRENPVYRERPVFQCMVLDFVLKSSEAGRLEPPVRLNPEALALLYGSMVDGTVQPNDNLLRKYEALRDSAVAGEIPHGHSRWLVFKGGNWSKGNDCREEGPLLAAESQGSGWCIGQPDMAEEYLSASSFFHVLKLNGRARDALRVAHDVVIETQGAGNQDPGEFWSRVLLYSAVRRLPFKLIGGWQNPRGKEARAVARQQTAIVGRLDAAALAARLQATPHDVQFASDQQIADSTCREAIAAAWRVIIDEYPATAAIAPKELGRDERLREQWRRKVARQKTAPRTFQWEV